VSANFRPDTILQRRNDFTARRIIFRVGGKYQQHIERQAQRIALNLNVALLHDVEQPDLNFPGEVRQFVDGKNAAIRSRQEPIVNGEFVGKIAASASGADRINVANDIGHGYVGSGELLHVAKVTWHPCKRSVVTFGCDAIAASATNWVQRVVIDFAACDHGNFGIEKIRQAAQDAALRLSA
jgi:hypothetical protein